MHVCPECGLSLAEAGFCPEDGGQLVPRAEDLLLGETLGKFRVARLLGVGGMGRVYRAVQPDIGSRVAIKVLSRECADKRDLVERFFAEARAVNLIRHENIVNVLDLATLPDGRPYIIMEYLDGAPLSAVMEQRGPMPMGSLARLAGEVLDALSAAHGHAIVHRDLKPDNIYVTPQGRAKVLDFGIAKLRPEASGRSGPTRTGSLLGTPHYMAPEQAMAKPVDARTDVYAMGVILYEGITGAKPFQAESLFDLLRKQVEEMPRPAIELRPDLPPAYNALIMRAMAKDPNQRHQSAPELAQALAEATQTLAPAEWAPLRPDVARVSIGPPSMATPASSSSSTPQAFANPVGFAPTSAATPTPHASAVVPPPSPPADRASRVPIWIGAGIAAAAVAGAIAFILFMGSDPEAVSVAAGPAETDASSAVAMAPTTSTTPNATATPTATPNAAATPTHVTTPNAAATPPPPRKAKPPSTTPVPTRALPKEPEPPTPPTTSPPTTKRPSTTPPATTPPPTATQSAFANFDVTGYLPTALARARKEFSDAVLVRIDADGVYPNGKADLTLSDRFSVLYRFVSPSRSGRPADLPLGVEHKPTCKYYVLVEAKGITAYPLKGWTCDEALIGKPACSAKQVWKKAIDDGAPSKNAVGEMGYWADSSGKGRWHFSVGKLYSKWVQDDC